MNTMTRTEYLDVFRSTIATAKDFLSDHTFSGVTIPQMLILTDEYLRSPTRLMIFGQETLGVETALASVDPEDEAWFGNLTSEVTSGFDGFDFALGSSWENTPFWGGFQEACDAFELESRRAAAWSNLSKCQLIDPVNGSYSINGLDAQGRADVVRWQRSLILAEIAYAQPHAVLFFTGAMTWIAVNTFRSTTDWAVKTDVVKGAIGDLSPASGTLSSPLLEGLVTAYTYHPNALRTLEGRATVREHRRTVLDWMKSQMKARAQA